VKKATQHKPTRDERKNKEVQDLKAENRSLRKQVSSLRKQLEKATLQEKCEDDYIPPPTEESISSTSIIRCTECMAGSMKTMAMPSGTIYAVCSACGSRQRIAKVAK